MKPLVLINTGYCDRCYHNGKVVDIHVLLGNSDEYVCLCEECLKESLEKINESKR